MGRAATIAARRARLPLRSERLELREFTDADAPFLVTLMNDAQWLVHIGDRGVRTDADARAYLDTGPRASYAAHGSGLWCVVESATQTPVGMCGIVHRSTLDAPDLGFAIAADHRRCGFALEAARAVLDAAPHLLETPRLLAITAPANVASQRVLERLGFTRLGERTLAGEARTSVYFEWTTEA